MKGKSCKIRATSRILLVSLGLPVVILILLYQFLCQPMKVEGNSMGPLISDQERVFINKFVYRFEPIERGDVVIFWNPLDRSKSFIKRVVGLPGETIEIRAGHLYIDGTELAESYIPSSYLDASNHHSLMISADGYFVMGDNRNSSNDSRGFGPVPRHYIYGKAVFAYWPIDHLGSLPSASTVNAASK